MRRLRRLRPASDGRWRVAAGGALLSLVLAGSAQPQSLEYAVKAAYLAKFAPFVSWKTGLPGGPTAPLQLCIGGEDPFGPMLEQAVAGQRLGRRTIAVRRMGLVARGSGCHVLYLAGASSQSAGEALKTVKGEPVLTITDAARRPDGKGVIHFWVGSGRVRFEIDAAAAAANGLTISSKLLALAAHDPGAGSAP